MKKIFLLVVFTLLIVSNAWSQSKNIWSIGTADGLPDEFALAPSGFKNFVGADFGYEDKFYLVGSSSPQKDFPYVLPGPADTWGGTWPTAGWRTSQANLLFALATAPAADDYKLIIKLADFAKKFAPVVKVSINNQDEIIKLNAPGANAQQSPYGQQEPFVDTAALLGNLADATPKTLTIPIKKGVLRQGGNSVIITVPQGSWIMFDQVVLSGPQGANLQPSTQTFVESVSAAPYELASGTGHNQPLIVNARYISGKPKLSVLLDDKLIFAEVLESGQYEFEAPMPAVQSSRLSRYKILENGKVVRQGTVKRSPQPLQTLAGYVDTRIGTAHSRWMIAPGPWMPFGMVKMSPDNQNGGWQAGYDPIYESIGTFSHIHEWTMAGLGIFATNGPLKTKIGDEIKPDGGYRSRIDKRTEEAPIGYYKADLLDYGIKAEVTATTRCGFERFTFPKDRDSARIMVDLHVTAEYGYQLKDINVKEVSNRRIEGYAHQFSPGIWSNDADQDYTVYFVIEFDQPIQKLGGWVNDAVKYGDVYQASNIKNAGLFAQFNAKQHAVVQVRSAISLVSVANAAENLEAEVAKPFGWSFDAVRQNQVNAWNDLFDRIKISTTNRLEKMRFYNAYYRSICSRTIWSDVNGQWRGTDGKVQQMARKQDVALGCDAFWNTFWNLNQLWNLATPEWSNQWVNSQLAMYNAYGWTAKGPAGMNYVPVMVGEHELPQMVSAYQMGIRDFDAKKVLNAAIKMQSTPPQKVFNGYAGNRDIVQYMKHHYVPADSGRFSNTMEYSFDDWTVGQLAKALGDNETYKKFNDRGYWWQNAIDKDGYSHMKLANGHFTPSFDPFRSGANEHYVEGNAWQLTFFVPQDVPALINKIGKEKFADRLEWGFEKSDPWRYNGMNDQYWDYPVVQGNEQSMHFAFLFNWAGRPWSTQKWSRAILDRFYGYHPADAYLGDEDQGQLSAWLVMVAMGLFQTDGGTNANPVYEIGSPLYQKIEIDLGGRYGRGKKFTIEAKNASRKNMYVQSATLNGQPLRSFKFPAAALLKGGSLILQMGPQPNKQWGIE